MNLDPALQVLTNIEKELSGVKARQNIMIGIGGLALGLATQFVSWTSTKFDEHAEAIHGVIIRIERLEHNKPITPQSMQDSPSSMIWLPPMPFIANVDRRKFTRL